MLRSLYRRLVKPILYNSSGQFLEYARVRRGSWRQKQHYGLLDRANYADGLFRAADEAPLPGKRRVPAAPMSDHADQTRNRTKISRVVREISDNSAWCAARDDRKASQ